MLPGWVALRMGRSPCGEKRFFFCGKAGWFYRTAGFLPAGQGPKPLFLLLAKEKVVLDSEKEKEDRRKFWGGAVQQDGGPILLGCSLGKILWAILLFPAAWV